MNNFNLSLDDMSPHPHAGLNFEVIYWCDKLIKDFPDIKINLFVPSAYARLNEDPHYLTKYPGWVEKINALPRKNYSIGLHGLYHRRSTKDFSFHIGEQSNNDEFRFLDKTHANIIIGQMIEEADNAGLIYNKIFRPPRWAVSNYAAQVLDNMGFVISSLKQYEGFIKTSVPEVKYISPTWDLRSDPPGGNLIICSHTSRWVSNFLDFERYMMVYNILKKQEYKFDFLKDIVYNI